MQRIIGTTLLLLTMACGGDERRPRPDAGLPPTIDSGTPPLDAGAPQPDAASPSPMPAMTLTMMQAVTQAEVSAKSSPANPKN